MAGGYTKAIEGVRPGDMVKSYDETTGEIENKCVLSTSVNETNEVVKVKTSGGETLVATPAHPFYANGDWIGAKDLRAGDILVNVNGEKVVVEQVSHEMLESSVKVYNFEVADNHTYLVGESGGVVVHNGCEIKYNIVKTNPKTGAFLIGRKVSKKQALEVLKNGGEILAPSRKAAKEMAKSIHKGKVMEEISKNIPNARPHFHDIMRIARHIFY